MGFLKDELILSELVNAFSQKTENVLDEIELNYNMDSGNFRSGASWDLRFSRIENSVEGNNNVVVLDRERGIWKYKAILFVSTGALFLFTKEKNLDKIIREKSNTEKIHYFHALVYLNDSKKGVDVQLDLFNQYVGDFEKRREKEVQKVLMDYYSQVKQVYFIVGTEKEKQIVEVKVQHFNKHFEFLQEFDLSKYISKREYEDVLPSARKNEGEPNNKLVGVKPGLKKRSEKQIPDKKQEESKEKKES